MQIKIVIGTVAFMIAMMVLGYSALREPSRMTRFTNAELGRSIEAGAEIFANNCVTCHGVEADAQGCVDATGNQIACLGLPLNSNGLLCGDVSQRMIDMGWDGTKHDYILTTVSAGRNAMPTWHEQFGGPLRNDQVQNVTNFVLNYESEELCAQPVVTYEWPELAADFLAGEDVTAGDPTRGAELYGITYGCSACHGSLDGVTPAAIGPALANIETEGGTRVVGLDAQDCICYSVLLPRDFIAGQRIPAIFIESSSAMPHDFGSRMGNNPQDMADILAALLQQ